MEKDKKYKLVMAARKDRSLAKYTVIVDFETEKKLQAFCGHFSSEHDMLHHFYGRYDFMYALLGDNFEDDMQAVAYDRDGNPIEIKYKEKSIEKVPEHSEKSNPSLKTSGVKNTPRHSRSGNNGFNKYS